MLGFRTRSSIRDRDTDRLRLSRLQKLVEDLLTEINSEKLGLQRRYDEAIDDAAFLLDRIENQMVSGDENKRTSELTTATALYQSRLQDLSRQSEYYQGIKKLIADENTDILKIFGSDS